MSQTASLLKVHLAGETDFLLARQRARQIAALLGFELQDQTRIATAVSEIARNAFEYAREGRAEFVLDQGGFGGPALRIVISDTGKGIPNLEEIWSGGYASKTGMGLGLIGARRLMDELEVETSASGTRVTLLKRLPRTAQEPPSPAAIAAGLAQSEVRPTSALRDQNQELLSLLSDLRARESELRTLNQELEETNRGVLVLYAELADKAQAVQQANEMKTRFLSGVTHELRTPLNSIVSLSRLMLAHADGPLNPEQEKQVNFILRSAGNLTEMVSDLLDLAKIEAGRATTNLTHFNVADLFAGLRGMFRPLAVDPRVRLLFEAPDSTLELRTDEGKLAQILRNFISNALKFTHVGSVRVRAEALGHREVRFSVIDTGVGIRAEDHDLVMQEWGQTQNQLGTGAHARGSGLGLPLARSLAELLGGSVDFTSEVGKGSTFNVTLPARVVEAPVEIHAGAGYILVCDDDEVARYLLRRHLAGLTATRMEEAASGKEALEKIAESVPSLLFLDMLMPGQGGTEVLRELRANPRTAHLPVALYTAKPLTPEEQVMLAAFDVTIVPKRPQPGGADNVATAEGDEHKVHLERMLLQVGLCNLHEGRA